MLSHWGLLDGDTLQYGEGCLLGIYCQNESRDGMF